MKKVIGIIDPGWVEYTDTSDLYKGRGGSETWAIQLSAEFQKRGYHVVVFGNVKDWHFNIQGVEWVPMHLLSSRCNYQHFDHIIASRIVGNYIDIIESTGCCDNIWIQAHDVWVLEGGTNSPINLSEWFSVHSTLKGVLALSDNHTNWIISHNNINRSKIYMTGNGLAFNLFNNIDYKSSRGYDLFWSSRPERGLNYMINDIMPRIRKVHPESRLRVASYDNIPVEGEYDYVDFLGNLSKQDLYSEMARCRVWIYPATFPETFCITALENIMCGCIPIIPKRDGMVTTMGPFQSMMLPDKPFNTEEYFDLVSESALYYMDNYEQKSVIDLRLSLMTHIRDNYSWSNIVDKFEQIWN